MEKAISLMLSTAKKNVKNFPESGFYSIFEPIKRQNKRCYLLF